MALGLTSRLFHRIISIKRIQDRLADGIKVDTTDTKTRIDNLVKLIIQDEDVYPADRGPTMEIDDGIMVDGVETSSLTIPQFFAELKPVSDALKELAELEKRDFWIDTLGGLQFRDPVTVDSGVLFTDDPAQSWEAAKMGLILDDTPFEVEKIIEGHTVNRIIGVGGDEREPDQEQPTVSSGPDSLGPQFLAMKFTPDANNLSYLAINIDKIGSPQTDLVGEIRETFDDARAA